MSLKSLLNEDEAAELLAVKPQTLAVWRCRGMNNLKFVKVGRAVRYRLSDIEEWLEQRTATCSAGHGC
ncbi:helix-turn-helix domain-containing protein [Schlesneria sp. DSM 10557]|uniref:helix-turn-helix domain-containing protein n=1 Tax=Schlesneria sp. DSM 10557 TaxID=3044399 RepID=UPI0035A120AB